MRAPAVSLATGNGALNGYYVSYEIVMTTRVENAGSETYILTDSDLFMLAYPLFMNNSFQKVILTGVNHPWALGRDEDGNALIVFNISRELPPKSEITLNASYVAYVYATPPRMMTWEPELNFLNSGAKSDIPEALIKDYCRPAGPWLYNASGAGWSGVRETAASLAGNETNVLILLHRFINWIGLNVKYQTHEIVQYPNETFIYREGDCDEQSNLLIAMCRYVGIPAYLQVGCIYLPREGEYKRDVMADGHLTYETKNMAWHGWAVVYVPPWGWLPVDLTFGYEKEDPLSAIQKAAIQSVNVIVSENIFASNYVGESNKALMKLRESSLYIHERQSLKPTRIVDAYPQSPKATFKIVCLIVTGTLIVTVYLLMKLRKTGTTEVRYLYTSKQIQHELALNIV
jgi:transglutaminase-like putative cysteine protease